MPQKITFTRNYSDLSTNKGFQFEFFCDRCGTGYRTRFKPFAIGNVASALDATGGFFGGILSRTAGLAEKARSASWQKAHDDAFVEAANELRPDFVQCPRCSAWVCKERCWNNTRGLCKNCAPDMSVEMAAAQASRTVEELWAHSQVAEEDRTMLKTESWRQGVRATCPGCGAPIDKSAKFCSACGTKLVQTAHCPQCGAKLTEGAKFCGSCGAQIGDSKG